MENIFLFDAPWDMEQTQTPYRFAGEIDWACRPAGDPEWTYMLARHGFVLHLAQAYALCGDACFAQKAAALAEDFLRRVPITEETKETAWRSLDAAIRISNWLDAFDILSAAGAPTEAFCQTLHAGARLHADYLLSVDTPFCRLSNWGVIGNAGLYQAALFLRDEAAEAEALRCLADEVHLQIRTDGWQWEQSPMYHVEVLSALCPAPLPLFGAHAPSGNYYLRTGWGETDSCIHFHCGTMGGGHGHVLVDKNGRTTALAWRKKHRQSASDAEDPHLLRQACPGRCGSFFGVRFYGFTVRCGKAAFRAALAAFYEFFFCFSKNASIFFRISSGLKVFSR